VSLWRWLAFWRPPCLCRRVLVTLVSDEATALQGVLWSSRGAWFTLKDAAVLKARMPPAPLDGEVVIHRRNIAFFQVLE
jgi:hypothetical protein